MKRSDFFIRLTTGVLFLAVASYIGISIYNAVTHTFVTIPAISYTIEETFTAEGFVVRDEMVLTEISGDSVLPVRREGERVGRNEEIAVEYMTRAALDIASEIRSLRLRISQAEVAAGGRADLARMESVMSLSQALHSGDFRGLDEMELNISTLVFENEAVTEESLDIMRERLERLEGRSAGIRTFYSPQSGYFSQVVDGFEHVDFDAVAGITPSELEELFETPRRRSGVGKLVTDFRWQFAAVMDAPEAARLRVGDTIEMLFSEAFHSPKNMTVSSISSDDEGRRTVVFSSDRNIHEVVQHRQLSADIVYQTVTGIRVPREALRLDDNGVVHIFLQTGVRAERVNVEILREYGDVSIVRDGIDAGTPLRSGSTIIVRANNLYHGRVVG